MTLKDALGGYPAFVAVINRKGGVGKTFVTANLGAELAARGLNVGLVDTDSQGGSHLAIVFGLDGGDGLYRMMVDRVDFGQVFQQVQPAAYANGAPDAGNLYVLPAGPRTFMIPSLVEDAGMFRGCLEELAARFALDLVLVDTGPGMSMLDGSIYDAADAFLWVTEPETLSLVGISDSFEQIARYNRRRVKRGQHPNRVLGIVPNRFGRLREHTTNLNALGEAFGAGMVWQPIRRLNVYSLMGGRGQAVRVYAGGTDEAAALAALTDRFEEAMSQWATE